MWVAAALRCRSRSTKDSARKLEPGPLGGLKAEPTPQVSVRGESSQREDLNMPTGEMGSSRRGRWLPWDTLYPPSLGTGTLCINFVSGQVDREGPWFPGGLSGVLPGLSPGGLWLQQTQGAAASAWSRQRAQGPVIHPRQALGQRHLGRVSVGLAIPGILVALICVMGIEMGQVFRLVPITE